MKIKLAHIILILSLSGININAQKTQLIKRQNDSFFEQYNVLKNDTSIKHGYYFRKYKKYVIEQGDFKQGQKIGKWEYFSLDGIFDFQYDYTLNKITKIAKRHKKEDYFQTPVFFKGSPIIPYIFLTTHVYYPLEAKKYNINGKISLAIDIDKDGKITRLYLNKKLHPLLDREVLKVAKSFPDKWQWIPATYNGVNTKGTYQMDIEFELIENSPSQK